MLLRFLGLQNFLINLDYEIDNVGFNIFWSLTNFLDFLNCIIFNLDINIFYENHLLYNNNN